MADFAKLVNELVEAATDAGQGWDRSEQHVQDRLEARVTAAKVALHAALTAPDAPRSGGAVTVDEITEADIDWLAREAIRQNNRTLARIAAALLVGRA